jgi:hypothetical protein
MMLIFINLSYLNAAIWLCYIICLMYNRFFNLNSYLKKNTLYVVLYARFSTVSLLSVCNLQVVTHSLTHSFTHSHTPRKSHVLCWYMKWNWFMERSADYPIFWDDRLIILHTNSESVHMFLLQLWNCYNGNNELR